MTNPQRPSFERLLDWIEGRLAASEAAAVAAQVTIAGSAVRADVAWLRAFVQTRRNLALDEPPPQVRTELVNRFAQYARHKAASPPRAADEPGLWQRLVAVLTYDSSLQPALAGARAAQATESRQLVYSTEAAEIAVHVEPEFKSNSYTISGQILPIADIQPVTFAIQLLRNAQEIGAQQADEFGEFTFDAIAPGQYQIVLTAPPLSIRLDSLDLDMWRPHTLPSQ